MDSICRSVISPVNFCSLGFTHADPQEDLTSQYSIDNADTIGHDDMVLETLVNGDTVSSLTSASYSADGRVWEYTGGNVGPPNYCKRVGYILLVNVSSSFWTAATTNMWPEQCCSKWTRSTFQDNFRSGLNLPIQGLSHHAIPWWAGVAIKGVPPKSQEINTTAHACDAHNPRDSGPGCTACHDVHMLLWSLVQDTHAVN